MTKQDFVANILSRDTLLLDLTDEAIRKRVREASAAYDIMVEELGNNLEDLPPRRNCMSCKYSVFAGNCKPCEPCFGCPDYPNWTPSNE